MAIKWVRSNEVVWEEMNGEAVLVSPSTGARWSLNATASRVWTFCDGQFGVTEIATALAAASGRNLRETKRELTAFCAEFVALGLLQPAVETRVAGASVSGAAFMSGLSTPPSFRSMGLGSGPRRRPSPRGNSGPG